MPQFRHSEHYYEKRYNFHLKLKLCPQKNGVSSWQTLETGPKSTGKIVNLPESFLTCESPNSAKLSLCPPVRVM
jgi:hypothetical protein